MDATSLTGDADPSYPHDSVKRQEREGKRDRRYTAERSIVCLVLFSIAHRMPSRPINSIAVVGMKTHTHFGSQSPVETAQNVSVHFGSKVRHPVEDAQNVPVHFGSKVRKGPKCTTTFNKPGEQVLAK